MDMRAALASMLLLVLAPAAWATDEPADALEQADWSAVVLPQTGDVPALVTGVAAGPDRIVAIGQHTCELRSDEEGDLGRCWGQPWISTDGVTWEAVEARSSGLDLGVFQDKLHGPEFGLEDIAYGPAGFVVYGWSARPATGSAAASVTLEPTLWRSEDGSSWSRVPSPKGFSRKGLMLTGPWLRDIAGTDEGYVLGGTIYGTPAPHAAIWTSRDGLDWTLAGPRKAFDVGAYIDTMEVPGAGGITAFAVPPARDRSGAPLIAVGSSCPKAKAGAEPKGRRWKRWDWTTGSCRTRIWRSDDGTTWTAGSLRDESGSHIKGYGATAVAATEAGTVLATTAPDRVLYSRDGSPWAATTDREVQRQRALTASGDGFRAFVPECVDAKCRRRTLGVWSSSDGADWERESSQPSMPVEVGGFIRVDAALYGDRPIVTASSYSDAGVGSIVMLGPPWTGVEGQGRHVRSDPGTRLVGGGRVHGVVRGLVRVMVGEARVA